MAIYIFQLVTVSKRIIPYARYTVGDVNGGEARTARERIIPNAFHAIGDGDGSKASAAREHSITNACHIVGDGDGDEARTGRVFVYHYISIIYVLNGRKVKP